MAAKVASLIQSNYSYLVFAMVIFGVAICATAFRYAAQPNLFGF